MRPGTPRASGWWLTLATRHRARATVPVAAALAAVVACAGGCAEPRSVPFVTDGPSDRTMPPGSLDGGPPGEGDTLAPTSADGSTPAGHDGPTPDATGETALPTVTLTVTRTGEGRGQVEQNGGEGISCGEDCSEAFEHTTPPPLIRLDALAAVGSAFTSWTGCDQTVSNQCLVSLTADRTVTASFRMQPVNRIFVTSTTYTLSELTSTAIINAACTTRARAAGLAGNFLAWADDNVPMLAMARGWVRTDGRPFKDTLTGGNVYYPPSLDELGQSVGEQPPAFSFVPGNSSTCRPGMTGGTGFPPGDPTGGTGSWAGLDRHARGQFASCAGSFRLYCLQRDHVSPLTPPPARGRLAFLQAVDDVSQGLAGLDAICQKAGDQLMRSKRYKALVATDGASAASRFNAAPTSPTWVRPDGIALTTRAADLFEVNGFLLSALELNAEGMQVRFNVAMGGEQAWVWTGSTDPRQPGTRASTCGNWSDNLTTGTAGQPTSINVRRSFGGLGNRPCVRPTPPDQRYIYCLEE